jgi:hypothetical protein
LFFCCVESVVILFFVNFDMPLLVLPPMILFVIVGYPFAREILFRG